MAATRHGSHMPWFSGARCGDLCPRETTGVDRMSDTDSSSRRGRERARHCRRLGSTLSVVTPTACAESRRVKLLNAVRVQA